QAFARTALRHIHPDAGIALEIGDNRLAPFILDRAINIKRALRLRGLPEAEPPQRQRRQSQFSGEQGKLPSCFMTLL
ncbi:MAG: hypothetical protein ACK5PY_00110, partial [bacterium]